MLVLHSREVGNNLKYYIRLAGMTNAEVAAAKGIAPESVSRHVNGRSAMSVRDAVEYAAILQCQPEQLLFERTPLTVIGQLVDGEKVDLYSEEDRFKMSVHASYPPGSRVLIRLWDKPADKPFSGMYMVIDGRPIKSGEIPQSCFGKLVITCFQCEIDSCKEDWHYGYFVIYPMPDDLYTLQAVFGKELHQQVKVKWACPVYDIITRPDLLNWSKL